MEREGERGRERARERESERARERERQRETGARWRVGRVLGPFLRDTEREREFWLKCSTCSLSRS